MYSRAAMSRFAHPSATKEATSCSRAVALTPSNDCEMVSRVVRLASRARTPARLRVVLCAAAACLIAAGAAHGAASPNTPQSRLLNTWLDLHLVGLFYPDTNADTLLPNLAKVAKQLGQPLPPIRFGETVRDVRRFRLGAVMIKRHPPPDTWILFTRSRSQVWKLIDDAQGRLRLVQVPSH
jgi:hypothetical protein